MQRFLILAIAAITLPFVAMGRARDSGAALVAVGLFVVFLFACSQFAGRHIEKAEDKVRKMRSPDQ